MDDGALLSGVITDALSVGAAIHVVAAITLASGFVSLGAAAGAAIVRGTAVACVTMVGTNSTGAVSSGGVMIC
jgi:hypothetical protein